MRRIFLSKSFVAGAVAALVFGAAASMLASSTRERVDDAPLEVPVGGVGDRVVYAFFAGGPAAEDDWLVHGVGGVGAWVVTSAGVQPPPAYGDLEAGGARSWEVDSTVSAYDAAHVRHDALVVIHNATLPADPRLHYEVVEHVDLDERRAFRVDENMIFGPDGRKSAPVFGGNVQTSSFGLREPTLPGLAHQGRTLALGQVLFEGDAAPPAAFAATVNQARERTWVNARALINEVDAYGVRTEVTYRAIARPVVGPGSSDASARGREVAPVTEVRVLAWTVDWMSAASPYAIVRETGLQVEEDGRWVEFPSHRTAYVLQKIERGSTFIPWGDHEAFHWATRRADVERTRDGQHYPADGTGSSLQYPLSDAMQNVENDLSPTLLSYRLWRQSHASAVLLGAHYAVVSDAAASFQNARWSLLFATPRGEAFAVYTDRNLDTGTVQNRAGTEHSVAPFTVDDLPRNPPTLAALEHTWSDYVSGDARGREFNHLRWGLDVSAPTAFCVSSAQYRTGARDLGLLATVEGGHSDGGGCAGVERTGSDASAVVLDASTGLVLFADEAKFRYSFDARSEPFADEFRHRWSRAASTVPAGLQPPSPEETAASSAGVLAVFLALYFWPTLKFLGAKAVLLGGYAKIHRSDLLNNPVREGILQLIRGSPGIHASDIARQANAGWGTIVYHLSVLERNKLITSLVDGRHKRFFPADTVDYSKRGQLAALMNANTRSIYELIEGQPGIIQGEIAGRTGLTIPTVIWHLQRLEHAGLVGRDKAGRRFHYFANPVYQPKAADAPASMEVQ